MARFSTLLCVALLATIASLAHAQDETNQIELIKEPAVPAAALRRVDAGELPVLSLDEAASGQNDTAAATVVEVPKPTHKAPVPTPAPTPAAPSLHPTIALVMAALVLCVTNNVKDADTIASISSTAGILTTVYSLVLGLHLPAAIALSVITIAGGSVAAFADTVRECARDVAARPLIDWDLLLVVQPALMLGVLFGVLVRNVLLPAWLMSTVIATALLVCGSLLLQASHRRSDYTPQDELSINESSSLTNNQAPHSGPAPPFSIAVQSVPLHKVGVLVGVVFGVAVLQAALVVAVPVVLLGYLAYKSYKTTVDSFEHQQLPRVAPSDGELKWTTRLIHTAPAVSAVAGIVAGTIGFGSDLIMVPYFVGAGLDRAIAGSTGSVVVLLSSLMVALECVVLGSVSFTIVILAMALGFAVKVWGHLAIEHGLSDSLRTPHFLSFSFACITLLCGIALAVAST